MDQEGKRFRFKSLRGRVVLLSFVYTTCPDVCSLVTISMSSVQKGLSDQEREAVHMLSITTDPEVDTSAVLKSYAERHQVDLAHWSFLTGSIQQVALVWKAFGITVVKKARGLVSHTTLTALLDREGTVRFTYDGSAPDAKIILKDLQTLLADG
ncbi:MAG: redoxin family protein, partial [Deltaproteobacteria bacterium]|nr:redoxin family protein [Deltaproteobacteria bacterium]